MMPGTYDLTLYRGDSYAWRINLWEDVARTIPHDLADVIVAAEIRDRPSGTKVVALSCAITEPNTIDLVMDPEMFENCPDNGGWDLQLTYGTGQVKTPISGSVTVLGDYTGS